MAETCTQPLTIHDVRRALARPLPGLPAQLHLAPEYRQQRLRDRTPPPTHKEAGVLILLYRHDNQLYLPLTRRTDILENHKGQISLPGGAREGGETLQATALREACEELQACLGEQDVIGTLTPLYIPPSQFLMSPFVAYTPRRPRFVRDPVEVAEIIETPLDLLLDPATIVWEDWVIRDVPAKVPFFHVNGHKVWGATAMVLSEFVTLLCG
jgi:8-oxo-dGTP pyrophosphatase MutT (NUDIX family)